MAATTAEDIEKIFRAHGPFVWRALRRMGIADADADDLCQEVFVIVARKLPDFEERSSLTTWLYGIAANVALAHKRRAHVQREVPTDPPVDLVDPVELDDVLADEQARKLLDRALATLDDTKRLVFVLHEIEEVPVAEIAKLMDCPLQTAYSRLYAAHDQVEASLRRFARARGGPA